MFSEDQPIYIIAEAGVNHNGNEEIARKLVDIAVSGGANAVKFQMFSPAALATHHAPTAAYQAVNLNDQQISQRHMLEKLVLPKKAYARLAEYCREKKIDFLCTPFDRESLDYLTGHTTMRYLKLPSGEVVNGPFLLAAARTNLPIILSTGMSSLDEIGVALSILHFGYSHSQEHPGELSQPTPQMLNDLRGRVTLLHCVSQYPAPFESMNLRAMDTLSERFGLTVGLSDHSQGITMAIAATACGARVLEKHFTYNVEAQGPDHAASLSADALREMVQAVRDTEQGMGTGEKACQPEERDTRSLTRRSVVASVFIGKDEVFNEANLTCKRPAEGDLAPNQLWELLGKRSKRDYAADDFIEAEELK